MPTANHVLLRRVTLTASAASVTFDLTGISGYTDLKLVSSIRAFDNNEWITLLVNGATTSISGRYLYGSGTAASSGTISAGGLLNPMVPSSWTANTFSNNEFYITNYAATTPAKSISVDGVAEQNSTSADIMMSAILWNSTAAITSVGLQTTAGSFATGSSFSLYGIANAVTTPATAPKADGGDIIKTDGTYWYHTFTGSGIFKPQLNLTCDYLMVSGGGGGSNSGGIGSGGGAGALLYSTDNSLAKDSLTVITVGAGGAKDSTSSGPGTAGGASSIGATSVSVANGARGNYGSPNSNAGDGGASKKVISGTTTNYTGGIGSGIDPNRQGGGGAGAGANGSNGGGGAGSMAGGAGLNTYSAWATATGTGVSGFYAGGGGGGYEVSGGASQAAGGAGGGGRGGAGTSAPAYNADDGTPNTGGGGGGAGGKSGVVGGSSGNGGSGIVIIRYPVQE